MNMEQETLEESDPKEWIGVRISEVYSPDDFWVQRKDKQIELENLEIKMTLFYDACTAEELLVKGVPNPGTLMAHRYVEDPLSKDHPLWLRCIALKHNKPGYISVFLFDYGTEKHVSLRDLRYLRPRFRLLPMQAIKARLAGIQPPNGLPWPAEATKFLRAMAIKTYKLGGVVARLDGKSNNFKETKLSLHLVDTVTNTLPTGIVISESLIAKDLAEKDKSYDSYRFQHDFRSPGNDCPKKDLNLPKSHQLVQEIIRNKL